MKFDLHCHSYFSDGALSPTELVAAAVEAEITHLALTDHDTLAGLAEAQRAADQYTDFTLINGVELSCTWEGQLIHMVGLDIDVDNIDLKQGVEENKQRRLDRAEAMFEDFEKHDIDLREAVQSQLITDGVPTRPHFAQALIEQGYAKNKKQAFKRYLVRGKPGYIPMQWPGLGEAARWVNSAGGIAVLAHPTRYAMTRTKLSRLLRDMIQMGVQGIEVSTSITDKQQSAMLGDLAIDFGLLASIGSDFHSSDQPWARLGSAAPLVKTLHPVWDKFGTTPV